MLVDEGVEWSLLRVVRIPVKPITDSGVKPITQSGQADHLSERSDAGVRFFHLTGGREPVREWLWKLSRDDRRLIGQDLMKVEFGWPCGPPLCVSLTGYPGL